MGVVVRTEAAVVMATSACAAAAFAHGVGGDQDAATARRRRSRHEMRTPPPLQAASIVQLRATRTVCCQPPPSCVWRMRVVRTMRMLQGASVASTTNPAWTQLRFGVHGAREAKVVLAVAQLSRGWMGGRRVGSADHTSWWRRGVLCCADAGRSCRAAGLPSPVPPPLSATHATETPRARGRTRTHADEGLRAARHLAIAPARYARRFAPKLEVRCMPRSVASGMSTGGSWVACRRIVRSSPRKSQWRKWRNSALASL